MSLNYAALTAELAGSHPVTGAYDANAVTAANQLNAENVPYVIPTMSGKELMDLTDATEYDALLDPKKSQWLSLTGHDAVDTSVGGMGQTIGVDIFGGGSTTAANIAAARAINISRVTDISDLLNYSGEITSTMVQTARGEI